MAWTDLSSAFAYGSQLTSTQMQNLRDNITALANGDSGAPEIQTSALADDCVTQAKISGLTSSIYELNKLDGVTASSTEIERICNGITATATEVNTVADGSTAKNSHTHWEDEMPICVGMIGTELESVSGTTMTTHYTAKIYIPPSATNIVYYFEHRHVDHPSYTVYTQLRLDGSVTSSEESVAGQTLTWETGSMTVSALSGWVDLEIRQRQSTGGSYATGFRNLSMIFT